MEQHGSRRTEPGQVSLFDPDARRLARAATALDTDLIEQIVQTSVHNIGVVSTWEQLVQPVWRYLGSRIDDTRHTASEYLYVQYAMRALSGVARPRRPSPPSVLLACADEELQVFPLEALVAALEESGASCRVLGARVPPDALATAARRLRPAVVIIWSQTRTTADPAQIDALLDARPAGTTIAAGPGWATADLSPHAVRSTDVSTALVLTLAVLEGHAHPPRTRPR
ncbi:cobalamin B12-binding domain-containing protein [Paractinoplanes hotanensis]|uniref:Cobalamin B12-binding domain-containing protein n=1 Tax=Paractinoplanes hotanensis TaxID=2906497 RepID=A0ABT0XR10_9ACTN|nr:cobalamin B12-binding domain-containing protein [Actinoplanes hotanensis]MCM4076206.1 cobalamin B12-binding domain-containing protein [Actinoplanes hotanensis]